MKRKLKVAELLLCVFLLSPLTAYADNVRVSPDPGPATMILLGTGLIGLAILGRKKFRK